VVSEEAKHAAKKVLDAKERILSDCHEITNAITSWTHTTKINRGDDPFSVIQLKKLKDSIEQTTNQALARVTERFCEFMCGKVMVSYALEINKCDPYIKPRDPTIFVVGEAVEVRYQGRKVYHPGVIESVNSDNKYTIKYDDNAKEENVDSALIR
jgi:hypothetical protein